MGNIGIIVSVTPEIALEEGYTYAGGLGVLEGDKFYTAGDLGIRYLVLTLFYENGYVDYDFKEDGSPIPRPQPQPDNFLSHLQSKGKISVKVRGENVLLEAFSYKYKTAETIFFHPIQPGWVHNLVDKLYIEEHYEDRFYKYVLLARASAEYIRTHVTLNRVSKIILNEAYTALLPLVLRAPEKYIFIIHTPGPWGHPIFPVELFEREFGFKFISEKVSLTEIGLAASTKTYTVSRKHFKVMQKIIPHFAHQLSYVTNGVSLSRWMTDHIKKLISKGCLNTKSLATAKQEAREKLLKFIRARKKLNSTNKPIIVWSRRITRYKRPYFITRIIEEDPDAIFIVAGKAHPYDVEGLRYMKKFRQYHMEKPSVIYIHDYDIDKARLLLSGGDLLLFTPFPSWEACGTSFMKAGINGVPSLASRDGGVLELIEDGVNGWLFGRNEERLVDPQTPEGTKLDEKEYKEFKSKLLKIIDLINNNEDDYLKVALRSIKTFIPKVDMKEKIRYFIK
ncbi:MAG: glycogen/starch/alpha-glucan phosphorylase [Thermoproteales archaeon]|nr:glycogen/starch/alpha-glucan phosphorylase [Thermoproteales archaeon]